MTPPVCKWEHLSCPTTPCTWHSMQRTHLFSRQIFVERNQQFVDEYHFCPSTNNSYWRNTQRQRIQETNVKYYPVFKCLELISPSPTKFPLINLKIKFAEECSESGLWSPPLCCNPSSSSSTSIKQCAGGDAWMMVVMVVMVVMVGGGDA